MIKSMSFWEGVLVAFLLSVTGSFCMVAFSWVFGAAISAKLTLVFIVFIYLGYMMWRSPKRQGRVVVFSAWLILTLVLMLLNPGFVAYLIVQFLLVWVARSFFFYRSIMVALCDLLLVVVGVMLAVGVYVKTMSIGLAVWSLFLTQALCSFVHACAKKGSVPLQVQDDCFDKAYSNAEAALRKLSNQV